MRPPRPSGAAGSLGDRLLALVVPDPEAREGVLGDLQERSASGPASIPRRALVLFLLVAGYGGERLRYRIRAATANRVAVPHLGESRVSELLQDVRFAVRTLIRSYGFTAAAVVTLALGIGAATAMFGVLNVALLRALPYEEPQRLVLARTTFEGNVNNTSSSPDFDDVRAQNDVFEVFGNMAGFPLPATVTGVQEPYRAALLLVSWDLFDLLGVAPALGRDFTAAEGADGGLDVAIVSDSFWRNRLGGRADIVGSTITLDGNVATVVGVMPSGFRFVYEVDVWYPYRPNGMFAGGRQYHNWVPVGRLRDGVTLQQAQEQVEIIMANLAAEYPDTNEGKSMLLLPLHDALAAGYSNSLWTLMYAVALVLLIACGNIANLQLARGTTRRPELAVRAALGAGRLRLVRQLLTESLVLAVVAGLLGVLLAVALQDVVFRTVSTSLGISTGAGPTSVAMLVFAALVSLACSVLFGTLPALRMTARSLIGGLVSGGRAGAAPVGSRVRSALVVAQVALSVALLIGAGLLVRGFASLVAVEPGFDPSDLLTAEVALPRSDYPLESRQQFFGQLTEAMRAVPGVTGVGAISQLPIVNPGNNIYVYDSRAPQQNPAQMQTAMTRIVWPGYFETMRIPLLAGRRLAPSDTADAAPVMLINDIMAANLFPGESPLGKQVVIASDDPVAYEVVGVVGDVLMGGLASSAFPSMYRPYAQARVSTLRLALRFAGDPAAITPALRDALWKLDPNIPIELTTMETVIGESGAITQSRLFTSGLSLFAAVALLLASVGLYGMLAYYVNLRRREIGVRMALGAHRADLVAMVLRHGLVLAAIGVALGVGMALPGTRLIEQQLFGITATDPVTLAAVVAFFALVAALACLIPAVRATRVEPVTVLREE